MARSKKENQNMSKIYLTPRYIFNKVKLKLYEKKHPNHPWLTARAIALLDTMIKPDDIGLEFGSGRSTLWLSKRCKQLTSVEDNKEWFNIVEGQIKQQGNVDYFFKSSEAASQKESDYFKIIETFEDNSIDFSLVDGSHRCILARTSIKKLKPGGLLILDNSNWFLANKTHSPSSVLGDDSNMTAEWQEFTKEVSGFRKIWTSNGVTDTTIYIKK